MRKHATDINGEAKKQGLIVDYKTFVKTPADPNDWDFMSCTAYESYSRALDFIQGDEEKFDAIVEHPARDAHVPRHHADA